MKRAAIITVSDSGYRGEREDLSGPAIKTCDAEPCDSRNPREDTDRKSSGQPESSAGKSGIYYRCTGTRA